MKNRIYIAGPMTGLPDFNYPAFNLTAAYLRGKGHEVVNPAELFEGQTGHPWEHYMRAGLSAMLTCDTIALLPDWSKSRGAWLEQNLAAALKFRQIIVPKDLV